MERLAVEIGEQHTLRRDHGNVAIGEKNNIACMVQDCGDIGSDEIFLVAHANHQGRPIARGNNFIGLVQPNDGQSKHSAQ